MRKDGVMLSLKFFIRSKLDKVIAIKACLEKECIARNCIENSRQKNEGTGSSDPRAIFPLPPRTLK